MLENVHIPTFGGHQTFSGQLMDIKIDPKVYLTVSNKVKNIINRKNLLKNNFKNQSQGVKLTPPLLRQICLKEQKKENFENYFKMYLF